MTSYKHEKLIELIVRLDTPPANSQEFLDWIKARAHLDLLLQNATSDEIIISANGEYTFIYTAVISNDELFNLNKDDLIGWCGSPYQSAASYVYGAGRDDVWVENEKQMLQRDTPNSITNLVFERTMEGAKDEDRRYFEISQEYAHLTDIHWRTEHDAYVQYDENGDINHVVSATDNHENNVSLVTFKREQLEQYLAATNSSLIRRFDFTLLDRAAFSSWSKNPEQFIEESQDFYYRQKIDGNAAYTTGIQIISLSRAKEDIFRQIKGGFVGGQEQEYASFIVHDWRNDEVTKVSTAPEDTTNYFEVDKNDLPFELSPAFFRPDVLLKYKTDRDKYTVTEREVECRAAWRLRGYDINEAGQVHAYICDLRKLPFSEQQYWASYNEEPKASISERAVINDFHGRFSNIVTPLAKVLRLIQEWDKRQVAWWQLKDKDLLKQVNLPLTSSKDEWAEAFMSLSKLVIEGFNVKAIRLKLDEKSISYTSEEKSIGLLEGLIKEVSDSEKLTGLRTSQLIRTKVKGHSNGSDAKKLEKDALNQHKTFKKHFEYVCSLISDELNLIEDTFLDGELGS